MRLSNLAACLGPVALSGALLACNGSKGSPTGPAGAGGSTSASGSPATATGTGGAGESGAGTTTTSSSTGTSTPGTGPTVGDFIGVNGFVNDRPEVLTAFGTVREYHTWDWNQTYYQGGNAVSTDVHHVIFQGAESTWNFDDFYKTLHDAGVLAFPTVQGSTPSVSGSGYASMKPIAAGADSTSPASYADHGRFLFQLAARYGGKTHDPSELTLQQGQPALSGLGYLGGIEDWNEEENTFAPKTAQFTAEEYAAMASADYDGDKGSLGPGVGVKVADPSMRFLMGGLAGTGPADWLTNVTNYLNGIKAWSDQHRGGSFPADVINIHLYCMDYNAMHAHSPEDCKLEETVHAVVAWRDANEPGKEVWHTEFGYDVNPGSWNKAIAIGPYDVETVQAQWITRGYFALLLSGVDRATVFMTRDNGGDSVFSSPGVVTETFNNGNAVADSFKARPAFYFLTTLRGRLGAMHLDKEVASGSANVRVIRFLAPSGKAAYAVWAPTSDGTTVAGYALDVGAATSLTEVDLAAGSMNGVEKPATPNGGKVSVNVSETPLLVIEQ